LRGAAESIAESVVQVDLQLSITPASSRQIQKLLISFRSPSLALVLSCLAKIVPARRPQIISSQSHSGPKALTCYPANGHRAKSILLRYYEAVHHACLHSFNPSNARGSEVLHPNPVQLGTEGHSKLLVIQPRWCRCCLERRKAVLAEGLVRRLTRSWLHS